MLSVSGFTVVNEKVTRQASGSLLDHIVTNIERGKMIVNTMDNDISDHSQVSPNLVL